MEEQVFHVLLQKTYPKNTYKNMLIFRNEMYRSSYQVDLIFFYLLSTVDNKAVFLVVFIVEFWCWF